MANPNKAALRLAALKTISFKERGFNTVKPGFRELFGNYKSSLKPGCSLSSRRSVQKNDFVGNINIY